VIIEYYVVMEKTKSSYESIIKITPDKGEAEDFMEMVDTARGSTQLEDAFIKSQFQIVTLRKKVKWD